MLNYAETLEDISKQRLENRTASVEFKRTPRERYAYLNKRGLLKHYLLHVVRDTQLWKLSGNKNENINVKKRGNGEGTSNKVAILGKIGEPPVQDRRRLLSSDVMRHLSTNHILEPKKNISYFEHNLMHDIISPSLYTTLKAPLVYFENENLKIPLSNFELFTTSNYKQNKLEKYSFNKINLESDINPQNDVSENSLVNENTSSLQHIFLEAKNEFLPLKSTEYLRDQTTDYNYKIVFVKHNDQKEERKPLSKSNQSQCRLKLFASFTQEVTTDPYHITKKNTCLDNPLNSCEKFHSPNFTQLNSYLFGLLNEPQRNNKEDNIDAYAMNNKKLYDNNFQTVKEKLTHNESNRITNFENKPNDSSRKYLTMSVTHSDISSNKEPTNGSQLNNATENKNYLGFLGEIKYKTRSREEENVLDSEKIFTFMNDKVKLKHFLGRKNESKKIKQTLLDDGAVDIDDKENETKYPNRRTRVTEKENDLKKIENAKKEPMNLEKWKINCTKNDNRLDSYRFHSTTDGILYSGAMFPHYQNSRRNIHQEMCITTTAECSLQNTGAEKSKKNKEINILKNSLDGYCCYVTFEDSNEGGVLPQDNHIEITRKVGSDKNKIRIRKGLNVGQLGHFNHLKNTSKSPPHKADKHDFKKSWNLKRNITKKEQHDSGLLPNIQKSNNCNNEGMPHLMETKNYLVSLFRDKGRSSLLTTGFPKSFKTSLILNTRSCSSSYRKKNCVHNNHLSQSVRNGSADSSFHLRKASSNLTTTDKYLGSRSISIHNNSCFSNLSLNQSLHNKGKPQDSKHTLKRPWKEQNRNSTILSNTFKELLSKNYYNEIISMLFHELSHYINGKKRRSVSIKKSWHKKEDPMKLDVHCRHVRHIVTEKNSDVDDYNLRFQNIQKDLQELQKAIIAPKARTTRNEEKDLTLQIRVMVDVVNNTQVQNENSDDDQLNKRETGLVETKNNGVHIGEVPMSLDHDSPLVEESSGEKVLQVCRKKRVDNFVNEIRRLKANNTKKEQSMNSDISDNIIKNITYILDNILENYKECKNKEKYVVTPLFSTEQKFKRSFKKKKKSPCFLFSRYKPLKMGEFNFSEIIGMEIASAGTTEKQLLCELITFGKNPNYKVKNENRDQLYLKKQSFLNGSTYHIKRKNEVTMPNEKISVSGVRNRRKIFDITQKIPTTNKKTTSACEEIAIGNEISSLCQVIRNIKKKIMFKKMQKKGAFNGEINYFNNTVKSTTLHKFSLKSQTKHFQEFSKNEESKLERILGTIDSIEEELEQLKPLLKSKLQFKKQINVISGNDFEMKISTPKYKCTKSQEEFKTNGNENWKVPKFSSINSLEKKLYNKVVPKRIGNNDNEQIINQPNVEGKNVENLFHIIKTTCKPATIFKNISFDKGFPVTIDWCCPGKPATEENFMDNNQVSENSVATSSSTAEKIAKHSKENSKMPATTPSKPTMIKNINSVTISSSTVSFIKSTPGHKFITKRKRSKGCHCHHHKNHTLLKEHKFTTKTECYLNLTLNENDDSLSTTSELTSQKKKKKRHN